MRNTMVGVLVVAWIAGGIGAAPGLSAAEPPAERGWLGAYLEGAPPRPSAGQATPEPAGVEIGGIVEDSPAEQAGLRASDRIVAIDGKGVSTTDEAIAAVRRLPPDSWTSLSILRGSDPLEMTVRLGKAPSESSRLRLARGWIGVETIDLPPALREYFGAPSNRGVMVSSVESGSPGESSGMELGDVVYEVGGAPVRSAAELAHLVSGSGIGNKVEIAIARSGKTITLESVVAKAPEKN